MIVHFVAEDRDFAQHATIYGPGHANSWRLYDKKTKREYALLFIKNIGADGEIYEEHLDKPRPVEFSFVKRIVCEAHFERPAKEVKMVDMIEEGIELYENRRTNPKDPASISSQWPYNVYDIKVMYYDDKDDPALVRRDTRSRAVAPKAARPSAPKVAAPSKATTPKAVPPAKPKPIQRDSMLTKTPPVKGPIVTKKAENFGNNVEAGKTYQLSNLLFQQSEWTIQASSYPELDTLTALMKRHPTMEIELAGHTDNIGNPKLNVDLSRRRVETAKSYLVNKGIEPGRIKTQAYGGSRPLANNGKEETRRLNRRVEVTILKQ
ncbi:OmpA family protein [Tellurirhabdus bombi]|uniref:OmpA family protein n=1 Tax=Tellurirhabdus bombi TaxID=2907205 RepID=UPI001F2E2299|nr:OmpA family protein [Tellurirhabdus bombi]